MVSSEEAEEAVSKAVEGGEVEEIGDSGLLAFSIFFLMNHVIDHFIDIITHNSFFKT